MMTAMTVSHEPLPQPDPVEIARRLRAYMGEQKISRSKLSMASGIGRTPLGSKLDGEGKFTVDEVLAISRALGRSWVWVMTGEDIPTPNPPDGVSGSGGARNDLLSKRRHRSAEPPGSSVDRKRAA